MREKACRSQKGLWTHWNRNPANGRYFRPHPPVQWNKRWGTPDKRNKSKARLVWFSVSGRIPSPNYSSTLPTSKEKNLSPSPHYGNCLSCYPKMCRRSMSSSWINWETANLQFLAGSVSRGKVDRQQAEHNPSCLHAYWPRRLANWRKL